MSWASFCVAYIFTQVKFWEGGDPPPCFTIDGVNYIYVRKNGLLFAVSTQWNVSPSMFLELLNRLAKVFKDYCGVLSEVRCRCTCMYAARFGVSSLHGILEPPSTLH